MNFFKNNNQTLKLSKQSFFIYKNKICFFKNNFQMFGTLNFEIYHVLLLFLLNFILKTKILDQIL